MPKKNYINFDWDEMEDRYKNGKLKENLDCKEYIESFFAPTTAGTHVHFEDGKPTIIQDATMKTVYLARFPKDITKWYNTVLKPKKLICDIHKPLTGKDFINLSSRMKHKYKPRSFFDIKTLNSIQVMLDYIKLIWANGDEAVYNYIINWFANVAKGVKNKSCLYAKGEEGIGKSTLTDFFIRYIIGLELSCKGKSDHLKGQHNLQLLGKLLVVFEELQVFGDKEWRAIDSEIKDMITDDYAQYTDKYEKRFQALNTNNYIVNTNFNALKGANGRRYLVCDINPCKMNDLEYFASIRSACFNDEVGSAFYSYLMDVDTSEFNSSDVPLTQAKRDLCVELLTPVEKFLKNTFVLPEKSINMKVAELYKMYDSYCELKGLSRVSNIRFSQSMRELGLGFKKTNGDNKFKFTIEQIKDIATKKKWMHDLDNDEEVESDDEDEEVTDKGVDKTNKRVKMSTKEKIKHYEVLLAKLKSESDSESEDDEPKIVAKVAAKKGFGKVTQKVPREGSKILAEDASKDDIKKCLNDMII